MGCSQAGENNQRSCSPVSPSKASWGGSEHPGKNIDPTAACGSDPVTRFRLPRGGWVSEGKPVWRGATTVGKSASHGRGKGERLLEQKADLRQHAF